MGTVKYTGPVASFHCPTNAEIRSLKVHFSPKQLGEGDPSPENVREIEGWEDVEVQRCGENLFPSAAYERIINGITFIYFPNGDVHIEGTATANCFMNVPSTMYFTITPGMYTISGNINNSNVLLYLVVSSANGGDIKFSTTSSTPSTKEITFTDNSARAQISVQSGRTVNVTIHPKLERGLYTANITTNYEFGVLGKNKFDGEYPDIKNSTNLTYRSIYVGNQIVTASSNMPKTAEHQWSNLFILSGQVTSGAATGTNDFNIEVSRTITPIDGWITIAYRNGEGVDPREYQVQLEFGSTATAYEPYDPNKMVYGGWVDLISGELVATHKKVHTDSNDTWTLTFYENAENHRAYSERYLDAFVPKTRNILISDKFSEATQSYPPLLNTCTMNENRRILLGVPKEIKNDEDFSTWFNNLGGADFIYQLAEPIHYSLTPTELQTFLAQNNIWSNADYVEVEYDLHETQNILARKQFITANQPHVVKPAAAPLQNFVTDMAAPLKECKVYFNPVQEGEGDPSPDNIRPISGWDNLELTGCGVNLFDRNNFIMKQYHFTNNTTPIGTEQSQRSRTAIIPCLPNTTYTVYKEASEHNRFAVGCSDHICEIGETLTLATYTTVQTKKLVLTTDETAKYLYIRYRNGYTYSDDGYNSEEEKLESLLGSLSVEFGNNPESFDQHIYKPYNGTTIPITFPSEAGTVYGGYVDLIKGELVMTWECITITPKTGTDNVISGYIWYSSDSVYQAKKPGQICSHCIVRYSQYSSNWGLDIRIHHERNGAIIIGESFFEDAGIEKTSNAFYEYCQQQIDNGTPLQIAAELAEPIHYSLTPQTLKTLRGTNNIWSNSNGDITVQFWRH